MEGRPTELSGAVEGRAGIAGERPRDSTGASATEVTVRPGRPSDAARLRAVERAAGERFRAIGMDVIADDEPPPASVLAAAAEAGHVWAAELEGSVVGYAMAVALAGGPHLEQISVVPAAGGRGVGEALLAAVIAWADEQRADLTLSTFASVPWNAPWYERFGFEAVPEAELSAALVDVRRHEADLGLDVASRVVMRRPWGRG